MISFRKRFLKLFSVMYSEERGTTKLAQIKEQEIFVNPYVVQMDKFADSLQHLSKTFLNMEAYKGTLSREEIDEMFEKVTGNVCAGCERRGECLGEKHSVTYQMMYEILCAAEEYGIKTQAEETVPVCTTFFKRESGRIRECQADPDVESQTGAGKRGVCKTTYELR